MNSRVVPDEDPKKNNTIKTLFWIVLSSVVDHHLIVKEKPVEERLTQIIIHAHAIKAEKCHQALSEAVKNISILVLAG